MQDIADMLFDAPELAAELVIGLAAISGLGLLLGFVTVIRLILRRRAEERELAELGGGNSKFRGIRNL